MTDKRSPHPEAAAEAEACPTPKRAKTLPLAQYGGTTASNGLNRTLNHRSTAPGLETRSPPPEDGCFQTSVAESEESSGISPSESHGPVSGGSSKQAPNPEANSPGDPTERREGSALTEDNTDTIQNSEAVVDMSSPRPSDAYSRDSAPAENNGYNFDNYDFGPPIPRSPPLRETLGPWSPPPEPLRPLNPYKKGQKLDIRKHKACPPFGEHYPNYPGIRDFATERDLRTKTLVELCLEHPPMEGETAWSDPPHSLHIIDEIRVGNDGGAQLIVCRLDNEPDEYVAKIYDPLYYGFSDRLWPENPRDIADEADKDYCREVAAYLEMNDQFGGKEIPKYYGSWTFQMPLCQKKRDIRLILMERIKGGTMSELDPRAYPEKVRLAVLAQILEAFGRITFAGVRHGDLAQRNIMLCDGEAAKTVDRVVLIDFNFAVVSRLDDFEILYGDRPEDPDRPDNPINQWWGCGSFYYLFGDWSPESWKLHYRPLREWLYEQWGKSEEFTPHKEPLDWTDY